MTKVCDDLTAQSDFTSVEESKNRGESNTNSQSAAAIEKAKILTIDKANALKSIIDRQDYKQSSDIQLKHSTGDKTLQFMNSQSNSTKAESFIPLQFSEDSFADQKEDLTIQSEYQMQWNDILHQHEMIAHTSMDRKRENLEQLRGWDKKRAYFLNVHRQLTETIITNIDAKTIASSQLFLFFIHYFQKKVQKEMQYALSPVCKPDDSLFLNLSTKFMSDDLKQVLQMLDEQSQKHSSRTIEFANTINQNILDKLLLANQTESDNAIQAVRSEINDIKLILLELNYATSMKSGKVAAIYNASTPKVGYNKMPVTNRKEKRKDLYKTQLNFLRNANAQNETQRKLASAAFLFLETAKKVEASREQTLQTVYQIYKESFVKCYGENDISQESILHISKANDQTKIDSYFALNNIFDADDISFLKAQLARGELRDIEEEEEEEEEEELNKKNDGSLSKKALSESDELLSFSDIIPFFENFSFEQFDNRMLILREIRAQRSTHGSGNFIDTHIVVTADNFLHCFDVCNESPAMNSATLGVYFGKPQLSLCLSKAILKRLTVLNFTVELSIQQRGFLKMLTGADKYFFNFKNTDEIEEMAQFINSLV